MEFPAFQSAKALQGEFGHGQGGRQAAGRLEPLAGEQAVVHIRHRAGAVLQLAAGGQVEAHGGAFVGTGDPVETGRGDGAEQASLAQRGQGLFQLFLDHHGHPVLFHSVGLLVLGQTEPGIALVLALADLAGKQSEAVGSAAGVPPQPQGVVCLSGQGEGGTGQQSRGI